MKQKRNPNEAKYLTSDTKTDPFEAKNRTLQKNEGVCVKIAVFHNFYFIIAAAPNSMKKKLNPIKQTILLKIKNKISVS